MPLRRKCMLSREIISLHSKYEQRKEEIKSRLADFSSVKNGGNERLYKEMAFCMLTPQSKARRCWTAVCELEEKGLLFSDDVEFIKNVLKTRVRFHNNKAFYIAGNKKVFMNNGEIRIREKLHSFSSDKEMRIWLIQNIKGYGWKEASHFLRNIGFGEDIAILDRHILRNLEIYGVIKTVPRSLTPKKYLEIEEKMRIFCKTNGIPMAHLDLLFWSEETGEIFK